MTDQDEKDLKKATDALYDPATAPQKDGSSLSGPQLMIIMGGALAVALLVLNYVSGLSIPH